MSPARETTLSSRTSLRASSLRYSGVCANSTDWNETCDFGPLRQVAAQFATGPRIVQRAALSILRPEDILSACIGAELVAAELSMTQRAIETLAHIVCELGQNLLLHAGEGTITLAQLTGPFLGIEVFAQDQGPGIRDVERLLSLGRSGQDETRRGLFGVSRLADEFDIQSGPRGTHVRVVIYA